MTRAVPGSHGSRRSVERSGIMAMSPYPFSHDEMRYPSTVFISTSTARR